MAHSTFSSINDTFGFTIILALELAVTKFVTHLRVRCMLGILPTKIGESRLPPPTTNMADKSYKSRETGLSLSLSFTHFSHFFASPQIVHSIIFYIIDFIVKDIYRSLFKLVFVKYGIVFQVAETSIQLD